MAVVYQTTSPYYYTTQTSTYLDLWNVPVVPSLTTDSIILLSDRYTHRPDLLSQDLYGTPKLWWVFALRNPDVIKDPIYDMQAGIEIRIPDKQSLQGIL